MAAITRVQILEIIHKTCLEAEAEASEEKFAYTVEKIKTQKIGNDTYQLRESDFLSPYRCHSAEVIKCGIQNNP